MATRSTCGPPQAIKTDKNQSYICNISYGRSDWDFNLCCYKCLSVKLFKNEYSAYICHLVINVIGYLVY